MKFIIFLFILLTIPSSYNNTAHSSFAENREVQNFTDPVPQEYGTIISVKELELGMR